MLKPTITLLATIVILSSCTAGPGSYLKKSANNKLFDTNGFHKEKRPPLYNRQYIAKAKKNILNDNIDEDIEEDDIDENLYEEPSSSSENLKMYKAMIEEDFENREKRRKRSHWLGGHKTTQYPSLRQANARIDPKVHAQNLELREELDQIKTMLNETKKEMASYRCPSAKKQEMELKTGSPNMQPQDVNIIVPKEVKSESKKNLPQERVRSI
jgi:hypothetical protein